MAIFLVASVSAADLNQTDDVAVDDASVEEVTALELNDNDDNAIFEENEGREIILNKNDDDSVFEISDGEDVLAKDYQEFSDIQKKINAAHPGDTIYLNGTYYGFGYPLIINKPIKLVGLGNGAELKANTNTNIKQCAIFINQTASDVLIDNLIIKNGCDQWGGGILVWFANKITISNCLFRDNSADGSFGYGGAICLWAMDSSVINCTFENNHCTDFGGAIYTNNATSVGTKSNVISNCVFKYNYIANELSEEGLEICRGGAAIYSDCCGLIIDNCTFTENYARESKGGAIRLASWGFIKNSVFKDNVALYAKALYCGNTISTFNGNTFSLEYKEDPNSLFEGISVDELQIYNTFNKTRIDSSVQFSAGMIFEYGTSGSIYVTVDGGTIQTDKIKVIGHDEAKIDFKDNVITVSNLGVGNYVLRVTTIPDDDHFSVDGDLKVTVKKSTAVIKAEKLTVAYKKGSVWTVKLINSKTGEPISNMKLSVKVFSGRGSKTITVQTNSRGEATYQTRGLSKGNHKVVVSATDGRYNFNTLSSSIKVVKQTPLKFKVKRKVGKDGVSLSIKVMDKKSKKFLNGVRVKLLLFNGKNVVDTIYLKTMKKGKYKGICGYATNKLTVGTHKVVIMPVDIKFGGSAATSMKITAKHKRVPNWETKDTAK